MRQALKALIVSGVLLSAAACGTATNPAPGEQGAGIGSAVAPTGSARITESSTRASCEALGQVYSRNMAPLAEALTKLVDARKSPGTDKEYHHQAQQALLAFAGAIGVATQDSADPQMRTDGKRTADQLKAKAADAKVFSKVKTTEDVNTALGPTLKQWLAPVDQHCS